MADPRELVPPTLTYPGAYLHSPCTMLVDWLESLARSIYPGCISIVITDDPETDRAEHEKVGTNQRLWVRTPA